MTPIDNFHVRGKLAETDDSGKQQRIAVSARKRERFGGQQSTSKIPVLQGYGFSAHPPKESRSVVLAPGGNPDFAYSLPPEHPDHRPKSLAEGEWKLYDMWGKFFHALQTGWKAMLKELEMQSDDYFAIRIGSGGSAARVSGKSGWVKLKKGGHFIEANEGGIVCSVLPVVGSESEPDK